MLTQCPCTQAIRKGGTAPHTLGEPQAYHRAAESAQDTRGEVAAGVGGRAWCVSRLPPLFWLTLTHRTVYPRDVSATQRTARCARST